MTDIETLGTRAGAMILSIGAVYFDPVSGDLGDQFYTNIRIREQTELGMFTDPSTVAWWAKPDQSQAKASLMLEPRPPILSALTQYSQFARKAKYFWANDPDFDYVLMQEAYRLLDVPVPWKYFNKRSCRTIYHLGGVKPDRTVGIAHNALDDAIQQAKAVHHATKVLFDI